MNEKLNTLKKTLYPLLFDDMLISSPSSVSVYQNDILSFSSIQKYHLSSFNNLTSSLSYMDPYRMEKLRMHKLIYTNNLNSGVSVVIHVTTKDAILASSCNISNNVNLYFMPSHRGMAASFDPVFAEYCLPFNDPDNTDHFLNSIKKSNVIFLKNNGFLCFEKTIDECIHLCINLLDFCKVHIEAAKMFNCELNHFSERDCELVKNHFDRSSFSVVKVVTTRNNVSEQEDAVVDNEIDLSVRIPRSESLTEQLLSTNTVRGVINSHGRKYSDSQQSLEDEETTTENPFYAQDDLFKEKKNLLSACAIQRHLYRSKSNVSGVQRAFKRRLINNSKYL